MNKIRTNTYANKFMLSNGAMFFVALGIFVSIFFLYVYLVNRTVVNVVARQNAERNISALSASVGDLESKYMAEKNGITLQLALAKGFKEDPATTFIGSNTAGNALSYNSSR